MKTALLSAKRIVIKCGSALLVGADGKVRNEWLNALADDIFALKSKNIEVLVVSSGAVALGREILGLRRKKLKLEEKQAAASVGQVELMKAWQGAFERHSINCAQSLLTAYDTERRRNWLNARATFEALFSLGAVPIVNENDTIATEEIRYGDNDRLAARVAQMVGADCLLLLSDIDGLYDKDPRQNPDAKHIEIVETISNEIENMAGGVNIASGVGSGGMKTKIDAAKIATSAGCNVFVLDGRGKNPVQGLLDNSQNTWFKASIDLQTARLNWLGHNLKPQGSYFIDDGAISALKKGASLLPVGVVALEGSFERGDAVAIKTKDGRLIARGISSYNSNEAQKVLGQKTEAIEEILGFSGRAALVHRDNLVVE